MANEHSNIFGIDLGTTYSAISYIDEFGQPVIVPNEDDELVTPSAIYFETPTNVIVGKVAKTTGRVDPINYVELIKPHMGEEGFVREFHGKEYRPEQLSAIILGKIKSYAEAKLGREVKDVVITVPAYFNEQRRNATEQAGMLAGFNVKQIIPEPTAAALAYTATDAQERSILVYDLGGGTFDVTVIRVEAQKVRVVCVKGDHDLGGRKWDDCIAAFLASQWQAEHGAGDDPLSNLESLQELLNSAEEAKKQLSQRVEVPIKVTHAAKSTRAKLTREKFDELTASLLETTLALTRNTVTEADRLGVKRLDMILLVGGSSRMPQVQDRLKAEFPGVEMKLFDPELAVAKGAAIYANSTLIQEICKEIIDQMFGRTNVSLKDLTPGQREQVLNQASEALGGMSHQAIASGSSMEVINVCVKNYGLITTSRDGSTLRDQVTFLIKRGREVPAEEIRQFPTLDPNQPNAYIQIIECEAEEEPGRPLPTDPKHPSCRPLKNVTLDLPLGLPAGHLIRVMYNLSKDGGRLLVNASDPNSGKAIDDKVENLNAIQPKEMEAMKKEMAEMKYS